MRYGALLLHAASATLLAIGLTACGGTPDVQCDPGLSVCVDACYNLQNDVDNCGACGNACGLGQMCESGTCVATCQPGELFCGGACIDPDVDTDYCGATDDCQGGNAGAACLPGYECIDGACDCNADDPDTNYFECADDVCADLDTDANHCGACFNQCPGGSSCVDGICRAQVTYLGSLPPGNGRWVYGGTVGLDGGDSQCAFHWPGSHICTRSELEYAASQAETANPVDHEGSTVSGWWLNDPLEADELQCVNASAENVPWTYETEHFAIFGNFVTVDATGTLGAVTVGMCNNGNFSAACCADLPAP